MMYCLQLLAWCEVTKLVKRLFDVVDSVHYGYCLCYCWRRNWRLGSICGRFCHRLLNHYVHSAFTGFRAAFQWTLGQNSFRTYSIVVKFKLLVWVSEHCNCSSKCNCVVRDFYCAGY